MDKVLLHTGKDDWETPETFFRQLDQEFHFTLDPCSSHKNAKCKKHYTKEDDGLTKDWGGETVFCNPPYSRTGNQDVWVEKGWREAQTESTVVVMLLPARTDTRRFHQYILGKAEIRFIRGRLAFELDGEPIRDKKGNPVSAPFPSMVVVWRADAMIQSVKHFQEK